MATKKFDDDLTTLLNKICDKDNRQVRAQLNHLRNRLNALYGKGLVKINHSIMELLCAKYLALKGYEVDVEYPLNETLTCDIIAFKGDGSLIVEIETGYVPPEHALDPGTYNRARIASKIARYSAFSNKFALGTPPNNILQIPTVFEKPPRYRRREEVKEVKALCDQYYRKPPLTMSEIRNARLQAIYTIDVDQGSIREVDKVVCLHVPEIFFAVGQFYEDFSQTSDDEVSHLLQKARSTS